MKLTPFKVSVASLLLMFVATAARAQEVSASAGAMWVPQDDFADYSSYSWQLDYRQNIGTYFAASAAWINEGHVPGHHRDGWAVEGWGRLPVSDHLTFAFGLGSFRYYDTQTLSNGDSTNVHGWAPIYSLTATYYTQSPWFYQLRMNRINPSDNIPTNTVMLGVGYNIGYHSGSGGSGTGVDTFADDNEFTLFVGQSVVNTLVSESALAFAAEYRRNLSDHFDWTLGWIYEGDADIIRRNGLVSQVWVTSGRINERLTFGMGFGVYVYVDRKNPTPSTDDSNAALAGLVSPSVSYRFSPHWLARLTWNRILTDNSRDADVFLLGLGYRWGRGL